MPGDGIKTTWIERAAGAARRGTRERVRDVLSSPRFGGPRMPPSVDDRLEILDLAARYNHAVDSGDHEGVAALFTDDGVIEATATGPIAGRPAIAHYIASRPDGWRRRRHFNSNAIIEGVPGDGDAARLANVAARAEPPRQRRAAPLRALRG